MFCNIGKHYECTNGVCKKYVFAGAQRVAVKTNTDAWYYHPDHLGSSSIVTDSTGNKSEEIYYYPFGGTRQDTGSVSVKHKFTGQELDDETGLYYYGARYYDPQLGRFISADSIVQAPFDPQTLNRYSYCRNNPIIYSDPSGHFFNFGVAIVSAIIGAVTSGAQSGWDPGAMLTGAAIGFVSGGIGGGISDGIFNAAYAANPASVVENAWTGAIYDFQGFTTATIGGAAAGGAAGGAVSGGMGAAIYGGDIGGAMLSGAGLGALGGAAYGAMGAPDALWKVGAYGALGGASSALGGGDFGEGALWQGGSSLLSYSAIQMRTAMIRSSVKNPANASGDSAGWRGVLFKLAGGRCDTEGVCSVSRLGGIQGDRGSTFGYKYAPGSFPDFMCEAFSGPHDFLNSWFWYNADGNAIAHEGFLRGFGEGLNALNVAIAAPFALADSAFLSPGTAGRVNPMR